ncbi:hypothetical protein LguiA_007535 [Lonicera macranthoides]
MVVHKLPTEMTGNFDELEEQGTMDLRFHQNPNFAPPNHCINQRIGSAVVIDEGVNRVFPFVSSNDADDIIEVLTPMLFHPKLSASCSSLSHLAGKELQDIIQHMVYDRLYVFQRIHEVIGEATRFWRVKNESWVVCNEWGLND